MITTPPTLIGQDVTGYLTRNDGPNVEFEGVVIAEWKVTEGPLRGADMLTVRCRDGRRRHPARGMVAPLSGNWDWVQAGRSLLWNARNSSESNACRQFRREPAPASRGQLAELRALLAEARNEALVTALRAFFNRLREDGEPISWVEVRPAVRLLKAAA